MASLLATYGFVITKDGQQFELSHGHPERVTKEWQSALLSNTDKIIQIWDIASEQTVHLLASEIARVREK